jgi:hypothetical protein
MIGPSRRPRFRMAYGRKRRNSARGRNRALECGDSTALDFSFLSRHGRTSAQRPGFPRYWTKSAGRVSREVSLDTWFSLTLGVGEYRQQPDCHRGMTPAGGCTGSQDPRPFQDIKVLHPPVGRANSREAWRRTAAVPETGFPEDFSTIRIAGWIFGTEATGVVCSSLPRG